MTDIVEEARALLARATPGPWKTEEPFDDYSECRYEVMGEPRRCPVNGSVLVPVVSDGSTKENAALIAATPRLLAARDDIAQLRAIIARMSAELDEAIEDRNAARDDAARAAALLAVRTMERDKARSVGEAVLAVLEDFGWDLAVLRADIESERLAETVEGCVMLSIERALRAHAAGSGKGGDDG